MTVKAPLLTSSGTGRLSELARHVIIPSGITSTGWPAVRDKCLELGIEFDLWQDGAGRLILSKREDGQYATSIGGVVMSIPRQVGKTFLLGAIVFALCLLFPNLTVIWTAHRSRTAAETFSAMQGMAARHRIKPFVAKIVLGSGEEEVRFHNGSRILFGARERGFGRGFAEVDVLVFDEAQILTDNAIDDMVPATNQAPNPLILFTGTPPKPSDPGEVFARKRAEALSGESEDTVYIEFSADLGCDPMDREQWRRANPSHPKRTPAAAMLRMRKNLSDDSFVREALGIWDDLTGKGIIPGDAWEACRDLAVEMVGRKRIALDVSPTHGDASIAVAALDTSGAVSVTLAHHARGTNWVVDRLVAGCADTGSPVTIAKGSAAEALTADLERAGLTVDVIAATDYAIGCGELLNRIMAGTLHHRSQPDLDEAVGNATSRVAGERWVFDRRKSGIDITPICAVSLAVRAVSEGSVDVLEQIF